MAAAPRGPGCLCSGQSLHLTRGRSARGAGLLETIALSAGSGSSGRERLFHWRWRSVGDGRYKTRRPPRLGGGKALVSPHEALPQERWRRRCHHTSMENVTVGPRTTGKPSSSLSPSHFQPCSVATAVAHAASLSVWLAQTHHSDAHSRSCFHQMKSGGRFLPEGLFR